MHVLPAPYFIFKKRAKIKHSVSNKTFNAYTPGTGKYMGFNTYIIYNMHAHRHTNTNTPKHP